MRRFCCVSKKKRKTHFKGSRVQKQTFHCALPGINMLITFLWGHVQIVLCHQARSDDIVAATTSFNTSLDYLLLTLTQAAHRSAFRTLGLVCGEAGQAELQEFMTYLMSSWMSRWCFFCCLWKDRRLCVMLVSSRRVFRHSWQMRNKNSCDSWYLL